MAAVNAPRTIIFHGRKWTFTDRLKLVRIVTLHNHYCLPRVPIEFNPDSRDAGALNIAYQCPKSISFIRHHQYSDWGLCDSKVYLSMFLMCCSSRVTSGRCQCSRGNHWRSAVVQFALGLSNTCSYWHRFVITALVTFTGTLLMLLLYVFHL